MVNWSPSTRERRFWLLPTHSRMSRHESMLCIVNRSVQYRCMLCCLCWDTAVFLSFHLCAFRCFWQFYFRESFWPKKKNWTIPPVCSFPVSYAGFTLRYFKPIFTTSKIMCFKGNHTRLPESNENGQLCRRWTWVGMTSLTFGPILASNFSLQYHLWITH